jgi:thiol-disulfide isomerase/thioredoxin
MQRVNRNIVLLLLTLALVGCGLGAGGATPVRSPDGAAIIATESQLLDAPPEVALQMGDNALDFSYTMPDGSVHKLSELRGKKVLLNFWATWCGPCQVEMPELEQAAQAHAGDGLVILAVNQQEAPDVITPFAAKHGITFPLITNSSNDIGDGYGVRGLPTSYFINSDGTISFRQLGVVTGDFIKLRLEQMN